MPKCLNQIGSRDDFRIQVKQQGLYAHCNRLKILSVIRIPNMDEVTGDWRKLHNEELHNLYSSLSIIRMIKSRRMRWARHVARMGEKRNAYRILVGKPHGKRPQGRRRWVDNIKMDLREIGFYEVDWIDMA
jgi:hypothetical protein